MLCCTDKDIYLIEVAFDEIRQYREKQISEKMSTTPNYVQLETPLDFESHIGQSLKLYNTDINNDKTYSVYINIHTIIDNIFNRTINNYMYLKPNEQPETPDRIPLDFTEAIDLVETLDKLDWYNYNLLSKGDGEDKISVPERRLIISEFLGLYIFRNIHIDQMKNFSGYVQSLRNGEKDNQNTKGCVLLIYKKYRCSLYEFLCKKISNKYNEDNYNFTKSQDNFNIIFKYLKENIYSLLHLDKYYININLFNILIDVNNNNEVVNVVFHGYGLVKKWLIDKLSIDYMSNIRSEYYTNYCKLIIYIMNIDICKNFKVTHNKDNCLFYEYFQIDKEKYDYNNYFTSTILLPYDYITEDEKKELIEYYKDKSSIEERFFTYIRTNDKYWKIYKEYYSKQTLFYKKYYSKQISRDQNMQQKYLKYKNKYIQLKNKI